MEQKSINPENLENIKFEYSLSIFDVEMILLGLQIQIDTCQKKLLSFRTKDENKKLSYDDKLGIEIIEQEMLELNNLKTIIDKELDKIRI